MPTHTARKIAAKKRKAKKKVMEKGKGKRK